MVNAKFTIPYRTWLLATIIIACGGLIETVHSLQCYACQSSGVDGSCTDTNLGQLHECPIPEGGDPEAEDSCYTLRSTDGSVRRGCLLEDQVRTQCDQDAANCALCSAEDGCNRQSAAVDVCVECDSSVDAECAGSLNGTQLAGVQCRLGAAVDQVGCYRSETSNGNVRRGCVSSLPAAEASACSSATCKTCRGAACNARISFQQCRQCNSTEDKRCIRSASTMPTQLCAAYLDECYVHVQQDVIVRGCLAESPPTATIRAECRRTDDDGLCERCSGSANCNSRRVDGEFCVKCDSASDANCATGANVTQYHGQCRLAVNQRGCYLQDDGEGRVRRGCMHELDFQPQEDCRAEGPTCKTCRGNDCNQKAGFQWCRTCDSGAKGGAYCVRSPQAYALQLCGAYSDQCYTHVRDNVVRRGCLQELQEAEQVRDDCAADTTGQLCATCDDSTDRGCNDQLIDGEFCISCGSGGDAPTCIGAQLDHTLRMQCPLSLAPRGCFLFEDGDGVELRGCMAHMDEAGQAYCAEQGDHCKTCVGNDCNARKEFAKCIQCTSEAAGLPCIRSAAGQEQRVCRDWTDTCVTHVRDDLVTRGCLQELLESNSSAVALREDCSQDGGDEEFCAKCSGAEDCNADVVDGEFCIACESSVDANCVANTDYSMRVQCPLAVGQRGCYRAEREDGSVVRRGCLADLPQPEARQLCREGETTCKSCVGNDCNGKADFQRCRMCSSLQSADCIGSPDVFVSVTCRNYTDSCFTHVEGSVVTRGCLQEHLPESRILAIECTDGNCNNRPVDAEFCLECDSTVDPNCAANTNSTMRKQCPLSAEPRGCYLFADGGEIVKRGCLADIHPDEEAMCRRQTETCKTCVGDDCNAKAAFQRCRECNSADNVNCVRAAGSFYSVQCQAYEDECYSLVVDNIVSRGCLLQAPASVQETCATDPTVCQRCSGPICNGQLVDGEFCLTCDSTVDANCVSNLNVSMRTQCPLSVHPRGCYLFDDGGGMVKRGCVADLHRDEERMCANSKQQQVCKTCVGNDCNRKVAFESCKTCNSTENVDCIRYVKNYIEAQQCSSYQDECFTHVQGNVTARGCLADHVDMAEDCTERADLCEICSSTSAGRNSCNDKIIDGEFCARCDSQTDANCRDNVSLEMRVQCSLAVVPLGCYDRRNATSTRVERGCIVDLSVAEREACIADGDCKRCVGNECNVRTAFAECAVCDSEVDENCVQLAGSLGRYAQTCADYDDQCYTSIVGSHVTRGCLQQAPESCSPETDASCAVCSGSVCNSRSVEPELCVICSSDNDPRCVDNVAELQPQLCYPEATGYNNQRLGCYHTIDADAGRVERGCLAHLDEERRQRCSYQLDCKTCDDADGCNRRADFQQCFSCESLYDPLCVGNVTEWAKPVTCVPYEDSCAVAVLHNGLMVRDCRSRLEELLQDVQLQQGCSGNACNGMVFPADRMRCHQCSGTEECNAQLNASSATLQECREYLAGDFCFGVLDANGDMHRGCHSDHTDAKRVCNAAGSACRLCDTADGCNSQAGQREAQLSCIQCSDGESCAWGFYANQTTPCQAPVVYGQSELCYALFNSSSAVARRGCRNDVADWNDALLEADLSHFCSEPGCNGRNFVQQTCERCNSSREASCAEADVLGFGAECQLIDGRIRFEERGCYTRKDDGGQVTRGCVSELGAEERRQCADEEAKGCDLCHGQDCNTKAPPSSASLRRVSVLVLVITMLAIYVL